MNRTKKNFCLDVILFIAFVGITVSSLAIDRNGAFSLWGLTRSGWVQLHIVNGLLLVAGSLLHLVWHWDWIKAAFRRTDRKKPRQLRRNRAVDIWLFGTMALICLSGLILWPVSGSLVQGIPDRVLGITYHGWHALHGLGAIIMLVLMVVHLKQHWGWLVSVGRRYLFPAPVQSSKSKTGLRA